MADIAPDPTPDPRTGLDLGDYADNQLEAVLREATTRLKAAGIAGARGDARSLIAEALNLSRADLFLEASRTVSSDELTSIEAMIDRRARREPVARILGHREFWGLEIQLSEATLEPRPDSEIVVEAVLNAFATRLQEPLRILDLGTGSGCLLLALLSEMPNAQGTGLDLAPLAVETAAGNAERLGLGKRASFMVSDWGAVLEPGRRFDVIISNPPYIADDVLASLAPEVREHDPYLALSGGADGLEAYRKLAPLLGAHLAENGLAALEIGYDQGESLPALMRENGLEADAPLADLTREAAE